MVRQVANVSSNESVNLVIKFRKHPICNLYAGSKCEKFININRRVIYSGNEKRNGYMYCFVSDIKGNCRIYVAHGFIYECYNGLIPDGMEIDHINDIRDDNRLSNLQLGTHSDREFYESSKKSRLHVCKK